MSATWSWKSSGDTAVVRKTDDGLVPGQAITAINNNTNSLQYITGTGGVTIDNSVPGTTSISGGGAVQTVTNNATVLSASIASNRLTLGYSGTALPFANGGTNVTALPTSVVPSNYSAWDVNGNTFADGYVTGQSDITGNTTYTASNLPGLIFCTTATASSFTITLPDILSGQVVSSGFQTQIINVSQFTVQVVTTNGPVIFVASSSGTTMTVSSITGPGSLQLGSVISGAGITGGTIITSGPVSGQAGVYSITPGATFSSQTNVSTPVTTYPICTLSVNQSAQLIFVNSTNAPYWNYLLSSGYNGQLSNYIFSPTTPELPYQALYVDPFPGTSSFALVTTANFISCQYLNYGSGRIFLPDPSKLVVGVTYEFLFLAGNLLIELWAYEGRAVWEGTGIYAGATGYKNIYRFNKLVTSTMYATSSKDYVNITCQCIQNTAGLGTSAWLITNNPPITTVTQRILSALLTVFEVILSFAGELASISAATAAATKCGGTPAKIIQVPSNSLTTTVKFPPGLSANTTALARTAADYSNIVPQDYMLTFANFAVRNMTANKIQLTTYAGSLLQYLPPYSEVTVVHENVSARGTGYITGTTLFFTAQSGGNVLGSTLFNSTIIGVGVDVTTVCTNVVNTSGNLWTCTVAPSQTVASSGSPIAIIVNPNDAQRYAIKSLAALDSVAGNVLTNNIDSALQTINSNTTPTTILDNTAAAGIAITGTANAVVMLPPVSTISIGWYTVVRSSSAGTTTVQANNGSGSTAGDVVVIPPNGKSTVYLVAQNNVVADWSLNTIVAGNTVVATTYAAKFTNNSTTPIALNSTSSQFQRFSSGSANQTVTMPDVTTIAVGTIYQLYNQTLFFAMTVKSFDGSTILGSIPCGSSFQVFSISATDNSPTGWEMLFAGQTVGSAAATRAINYVYGGTNTDVAPTTALQYLRTTSTIRQGYNTATWDYARQPSNSGTWTPVFQANGTTLGITSQLCNYYVNTFFSGTAGATTTQVHCQFGIIITSYGVFTLPYTITLPFTSSQTTDFPVGITNGGNACVFAQIISGNNYLTIASTPGFTPTGGDKYTTSFFFNA